MLRPAPFSVRRFCSRLSALIYPDVRRARAECALPDARMRSRVLHGLLLSCASSGTRRSQRGADSGGARARVRLCGLRALDLRHSGPIEREGEIRPLILDATRSPRKSSAFSCRSYRSYRSTHARALISQVGRAARQMWLPGAAWVGGEVNIAIWERLDHQPLLVLAAGRDD
jgi:hypothetical protein